MARSSTEVIRFFDGLTLLDPGVVPCTLWRPDALDVGAVAPVPQLGGVVRKE
jgi:hypothetical protein